MASQCLPCPRDGQRFLHSTHHLLLLILTLPPYSSSASPIPCPRLKAHKAPHVSACCRAKPAPQRLCCRMQALLVQGGVLTIIKTSCKVMMGLGWHPREAEALATLRRVPCLDRAHLERGNTLHLEAKRQPSVTGLCQCHSCPKSWGHPGLGAWLSSATLKLGLDSSTGVPMPFPALPPAPARRLPGASPDGGPQW